MSGQVSLKTAVAVGSSLMGGVILGFAATVYHSALFPWGLIVAALCVGLFLVGMRIVAERRYPTLLASLGLLFAVGLLAGSDNEGSVLVIADAAGVSFLLALVMVIVLVNSWPQLGRFRRGTIEAAETKRTTPL